jgi:uncharacterized protein
MSERLIQEIRAIVERTCAAETNAFGYGIWTHHITRVADHALRLVPIFGADPEIVEIAALLHDYASVKDVSLYEDHHVHGPVEAGKLLGRLGYPAAKTEAVARAIGSHRASVAADRHSPEAECLANADALAHLENVPSLLHLAYVCRGQGIDDGAAWVRAKLERSWGKLSPRVREEARDTYEAALEVLRSKAGGAP